MSGQRYHVCVRQTIGVRLAEKERLSDALERVQKTGVHLVDAYLAASAAESELPGRD